MFFQPKNDTFESNFTNDVETDPYQSDILSATLAIIYLFGILFNVVSIITISKTKKMHPINILILNLAIADILYVSGLDFLLMCLF
jgi:hypothetical protein